MKRAAEGDKHVFHNDIQDGLIGGRKGADRIYELLVSSRVICVIELEGGDVK